MRNLIVVAVLNCLAAWTLLYLGIFVFLDDSAFGLNNASILFLGIISNLWPLSPQYKHISSFIHCLFSSKVRDLICTTSIWMSFTLEYELKVLANIFEPWQVICTLECWPLQHWNKWLLYFKAWLMALLSNLKSWRDDRKSYA